MAIVFAFLLLPAIVIAGKPYGMTALQSANAQFNATEISPETNTASTQETPTRLLARGLIGTMISIDRANITDSENGQEIQGDYAVAGRWRMFVNNSLVQRFLANFTVAKTDGSENYNVIIENIGQKPDFVDNAARITMQAYADSTLPSTILSVTVEIRDRVLRISEIETAGMAIEDDTQAAIMQIINEQPIYGIVEFRRIS